MTKSPSLRRKWGTNALKFRIDATGFKIGLDIRGEVFYHIKSGEDSCMYGLSTKFFSKRKYVEIVHITDFALTVYFSMQLDKYRRRRGCFHIFFYLQNDTYFYRKIVYFHDSRFLRNENKHCICTNLVNAKYLLLEMLTKINVCTCL